MISISVSTKEFLNQKVQCYIFFLEEGFSFSKLVKEFSQNYCPHLQALFNQRFFTGKALEVVIVPFKKDDAIAYALFIGLGKKRDRKGISFENYRRAIGIAVNTAIQHKCSSLALVIPAASLFVSSPAEMVKQTTTIIHLAQYHFNEFITDAVSKNASSLTEVILCAETKEAKSLKEGEIIAQAVNNARRWIDMPAMYTTPEFLANQAKEIAKKHDLKITVFDEEQINKMGMGGLAGVARGSELDCNLIIIEYAAEKKSAPTLAFVGKGITFDSGGLSIKPAVAMETMKEDMSGAAAVIAVMAALAELKPDVNIVAIAPVAENLPSGTSLRPGDIVRFYNGKTAEVKNTDAEGRLILADALSYAVKYYKPDAIIDIATLTGACAHALGPFFTGLMTQDDELAEKIERAAQSSGDRVWRLPLDNDYKVAIKSPVADICNIGSQRYRAGAITAAFFLQHFVDDIPWAHLDIAGTAFDVPDISYYKQGATGVGVRLLVDLAMNW